MSVRVIRPGRTRACVLESEEGMVRTIGVVTVALSDYGHLVSLLEALRDRAEFVLQLYVVVGHLSPLFGRTVDEIQRAGWPIAARVETAGTSDAAVRGGGRRGTEVAGFARAFAQARPDLVVLLGDRLEMLAAGVAALPLTIPVAHLHGGEITEGAIDEQARHALTKLPHLHFPAAEVYARRILQMGEEPWRVHCTGAPGLDRFTRLPAMPTPGTVSTDRPASAAPDAAGDLPSGHPRAR